MLPEKFVIASAIRCWRDRCLARRSRCAIRVRMFRSSTPARSGCCSGRSGESPSVIVASLRVRSGRHRDAEDQPESRAAEPARVGPEVEGAVVVTKRIVPARRKLKLLLHDPSIVDLGPVQVEAQLQPLREVAGGGETADEDAPGSPDPDDSGPRVPRKLNPGIHVESRA